MTISSITTDFAGQIGVNPRLVRITCNNTLEEITAENWLEPLRNTGYSFYPTDIFFIAYKDGGVTIGIFICSITGSNITLYPFFEEGVQPSDVLLPTVSSVQTPTVAGNFSSFQDTVGTIGDDGYSPTQPSSTKVVMFNGGTVAANYLAVFSDTAGTVRGYAGSNAIYPGNIQAGLTGTSGSLLSYPAAINCGYFRINAYPSAGNYTTTIQNGSMGQNTILTIYDPHSVAASILTTLVIPDPGANVITFDITIGSAALASGGSVNLYVPFNGTSQYKIRSLQINAPGTNFSGGGGDRLLSITDNTTVYSLIPAATLQALVNAGWGSTALPYPASVPINTSTAAGASLVAKYSGGTTDYSAGSVVISGMLERVI